MPGARSLPFGDLLREDGRLRSTDELRALFADRGIDAGDAVIATCGSGVTAAVIALALERVGAREISIYDGSWAEWGRVANEPALFPVVQGT
jgi:thiosulfate/3-mercaptopyruvate sulfurtransferase